MMSKQKLLSIAIPSYNSEAYMAHAIESLLPGGDDVEILIVNDGSKDRTAEIADSYQAKYPGICKAIHQENGGHGAAVMAGLQNATGIYFKVVDSDDWLDETAYPHVLDVLKTLAAPEKQIDLVISNFIYDKVDAVHKHVMSYNHALPENRPFSWEETRHFRIGQYLLMHSCIYRTELLRTCGLDLPRHTFYVDELYVYVPLRSVKTMYYINENLYHYFIGREDQSVQESIMIKRIDQALKVNKLMMTSVDLEKIENEHQRKYMRNYLEIVTVASSALLTKSGTEENIAKRKELWSYLQKENPYAYGLLRHRIFGFLIHIPGAFGNLVIRIGYWISQKIFGFN